VLPRNVATPDTEQHMLRDIDITNGHDQDDILVFLIAKDVSCRALDAITARF